MKIKPYYKRTSDEMLLIRYLSLNAPKPAVEGWRCGTMGFLRYVAADILHSTFSQRELSLLCHYLELYDKNMPREKVLAQAKEEGFDIVGTVENTLKEFTLSSHVNPGTLKDFL